MAMQEKQVVRRMEKTVCGRVYLTMHGLARELGLCPTLIGAWARSGKIRPTMVLGKTRLFSKEAVRELVDGIESSGKKLPITESVLVAGTSAAGGQNHA